MINNMNQPKGSISKSSKSSYKVYKGRDYICSCRTYEQAYYVRQELRKNNWDTSKLDTILKEYPKYYTQLLFFYHYVHYSKKTDKWMILIPKTKSEINKIEHLTYNNPEDALYERDFLIAHDWNYEDLVECIDDSKNPYYNMELPPYPERRIKNVQKNKSYKNELLILQEMILQDPDVHIGEVAKKIGYAPQSIRNWLKKYSTNYLEFKSVVLSGEDPFEVFTLKEKIYKPDLSPSKSNFKNYVSHNNRSKENPYVIVNSKRESFGWYPTRKLAEKIAKDLKKCNWDRSKLPKIQAKHNFKPPQQRRNYIYPHGKKYTIRKQINNKRIQFGTYQTMEIAESIRDKLMKCNWDKEQLPIIQSEVAQEFGGALH